jgi:hypothetical protein
MYTAHETIKFDYKKLHIVQFRGRRIETEVGKSHLLT